MATAPSSAAPFTSDSHEAGGLTSVRGFYYQWLYSLRLMSSILDGRYDAYRVERVDDYLAWQFDQSSRRFSKLLVVQVKHKSTKLCVLHDKTLVREVLQSFTRICDTHFNDCAGAQIDFKLVYNPVHHGCAGRTEVERLEEYQLLAQAMQKLEVAANSSVTFEPFLRLPLSHDDVIKELQFLEAHNPNLLHFFENSCRIDDLVKDIIGFVAPLHTGRQNPLKPGDLNLDAANMDRHNVSAEIQRVINSAAHQAEVIAQNARISERLSAATSRAKRDLEVTDSRVERQEDQDKVSFAFKTQSDFMRGVTKVHALFQAEPHAFWRPSKWEFVRRSDELLLVQAYDGLIPLSAYLRKEGHRHRPRIMLILSLLDALEAWSKVGLFIDDFRAEEPAFRDLYLVRPGPLPKLFVADLGVFGCDGLLAPHWARGSALAKALKQLYYGSAIPGRINTSRLYRESWNDNVLNEFSDWLQHQLPSIDYLKRSAQELFEAEICGFPFVISEIDEQFIRDCVNANIIRASAALGGCKPTHLHFDRAPGEPSVYYAIDERSQVGLLNKRDDTIAAHRFTLYDKRRWASARERDRAMGIELSDPNFHLPMFLHAADSSSAKSAVQEIFGISYEEYKAWMQGRFHEAHSRSTRDVFPPILRREDFWITKQRERLDQLRSTTFDFHIHREVRNSDQLRLVISPGRPLRDHLTRTGYKEFKRNLDLTVRGMDGENHEFKADATLIAFNEAEAFLTISAPPDSEGIPEAGNFSLVDEGADSVLRGDQAPLRILKRQYLAPSTLLPAARHAWNRLEELLGRDGLPDRSHPGLWREQLDYESHSQLQAPSAENQMEQLENRLFGPGSDSSIFLLTGAAGTGKTALVAKVTSRFLERFSGHNLYPPPRVVVIAASHYALDNFARSFRNESKDRIVPYRFVPPRSEERMRADGDLDENIHEWSRKHYQAVCSALFSRIQITPEQSKLREIADRIRADIHSLESEPQPAQNLSVVIPSHERWRRRTLGQNRSIGAKENAVALELLRRRLANVEEHAQVQIPPMASPPEMRQPLNPYAALAAPIIITTPEGLERLPDINCEFLIFEEASQLRLVKLLKVLTKLVRARPDGAIPRILMCGDSRQLPPYVETIAEVETGNTQDRQGTTVKQLAGLRAEIVNAESPFEAICRMHPAKVTVLSNQYRMHPSIARLVASLFYSDQQWQFTRSGSDHRVYWINTSGTEAKAQTYGTSRYNNFEVRTVARLVGHVLRKTKDVLIISPYAAQVTKLKDAIPDHLASVKTIDGCQGRQANTVIVSLVSLKFAPGRDFVVDPRRINVAFSRASDNLYLVGNLNELCESASSTGNAYPHMSGLASLFGPEGLLRHCVRLPSDYNDA